MKERRPRGRPRKWEEDEAQVFTLRLPKPLYAELRVYAGLKDSAMNDVLRKVIESWWAEQPEQVRVSRLVKTAAPGG